jgi:hypothetical protein
MDIWPDGCCARSNPKSQARPKNNSDALVILTLESERYRDKQRMCSHIFSLITALVIYYGGARTREHLGLLGRELARGHQSYFAPTPLWNLRQIGWQHSAAESSN